MKTLAVNSLYLTLARGLAFGSRAILLLILARMSTQHEFIEATITVTLAETFRVAADLGVETWLVRAIGIAVSPIEEARALQSGVTLRIFGAVGAATIAALIALGPLGLGGWFAGVAAVLTITGLIGGVSVAILQARMQLQRLARSQIPILVTALVVVYVEARAHRSTEVILLTLAMFEIGSMIATIIVADVHRWMRGLLTVRDLRVVIAECTPVAIFNMLVGIYLRLDVWCITIYAAAALPTYSVAFRLYQPAALVTSSMAGVVYAAMARRFGLQQPGTRRHDVGTGILIAVATVGLAVLLWFGGPKFISGIFPHYARAAGVVRIFAMSVPIVAMNGMLTSILAARGRFVSLSRLAAFNLVVFALALRFLVPAYGAIGAATALLLGETLNTGLQAWLVRTNAGVSTAGGSGCGTVR